MKHNEMLWEIWNRYEFSIASNHRFPARKFEMILFKQLQWVNVRINWAYIWLAKNVASTLKLTNKLTKRTSIRVDVAVADTKDTITAFHINFVASLTYFTTRLCNVCIFIVITCAVFRWESWSICFQSNQQVGKNGVEDTSKRVKIQWITITTLVDTKALQLHLEFCLTAHFFLRFAKTFHNTAVFSFYVLILIELSFSYRFQKLIETLFISFFFNFYFGERLR